MVISTYSNILLSVSLMNMTNEACEYAAENGHLDCLKYLHETAKAPWDSRAVRERTRTNNPNVYNTSSTTTVLSHRLAIRRRNVIRRVLPTGLIKRAIDSSFRNSN